MQTLSLLLGESPAIPLATSWLLAELGEAKGRQQLVTRQAPRRLESLREHALVESTISSNRIEGVEIEPSRVQAVVLGRPPLRDRNEEEVRGYRDALRWVHDQAPELEVSEATIRELHRLSRGESGQGGGYRRRDLEIVETRADGGSRVRFRAVPGAEVASAMAGLVAAWEALCARAEVPVPIALAAFNLDFLCVHPFHDGNGRTSRLLLLLQSYQAGFEVGRYVSLERLIEGTRERYYEALELSSRGWHEGRHDPWPYLNYLLHVLKSAYRELEESFGRERAPRGEKSAAVLGAVGRLGGEFSLSDLRRECPGVSVDLIRHVLKSLRNGGELECLGRGRDARWRRTSGIG